jgi:hypothetical protein
MNDFVRFASATLRFGFVTLLIFATSTILSTAPAFAKTKKANYGTIKILSNPGGLPIRIDETTYGVTTTEYRSIDLYPGLHTVVVTMPNGQAWTREIDLPAGRVKCIAVSYRPIPPLPKSPCPFPVTVSAPATVNEGEIITYAADVAYSGNAALKYAWTISPSTARVVSGAGTPTVTVDSTGLAGKRITATLYVNDGSGEPLCQQTAQASTNVPLPEKRTLVGREFDTCSSCSYDDQKARLDNLAVELQNDPTTTTYLIAYAGRTSPVGYADRLLARARDYLVAHRGIDGSRITLVNGGFRENDCVESWIVPQGAVPPKASPTLQPGDLRPATQTRKRRSSGE